MSTPAFEANPARVYNYLLGGSDNFPADRELAARLEKAWPGATELARVNRAFILRAVGWTVLVKRIGQFVDVGCGLPFGMAVHEAARMAAADAPGWASPGEVACVYADNDQHVTMYTAASTLGAEGVTAVRGDLRDPGGLLGGLAFTGAAPVVDLRRPVCVVLGAVLSALPAHEARKAVEGIAERLAPGSAVIVSCASFKDEAVAGRVSGLLGGWHNHPAGVISGIFAAAGLRVVHQRVMDVACWPVCPAVEGEVPDGAVFGGIAVRD